MDNHPIPQDVTNFQFKLIGDMTLKQFGYVAGSVIVAWIFLATPLFPLFRIILAGISTLIGVMLAFVPIDGRPADIMVFHFIQALFSPTQFVYKKRPIVQQESTTTPSSPKQVEKTISKNEEKIQIESFVPTATAAVTLHEEKIAIPSQSPLQPSPTIALPQDKKQEEKMQEKEKILAQELDEAKIAETKAQQGSVLAEQSHEKVSSLEKELREVVMQKQELEKQLLALQKSLSEKKQEVFSPKTAQIPQETEHVKKIPKQMSAGIGTPLVPDVPNLITGVIKDSRGNVLGNMLIEVKDKDNNPVRAFKTNQLGQFAAATPLTNGVYTISFEDPLGKQSFDSVEITANGEILLPLEIISVDAREKLRQELFGKQ